MRNLLLTTLLLVAAAFAISCGGGNETQKKESDEVIGKPPTPNEDPFFFVTMPAEAVAADPRGTIGAEKSTAPPKADGTSTRCFSCVKVCPVEAGETKCPQKDDIICGWGVHPQPDTAGQLAQAECDGALDLVRESPRWSRIEGACPPPSCE